jgi:hypothetical protein
VSEARTFRSALDGHGLLHLDASVIALHAVAHPRYVPLTRVLFGALAEGEIEAQTSALTLFQIGVEAYRRGQPEAAERAERALAAIPGLRLVPVTPALARQAAQVRAQLGGRPERAVQVATALAGGAGLFLTQRSAIRRVAGMAVDSLDLYAGS